jgi:hypothetical protein
MDKANGLSESRIALTTSLSPESFSLLQAEAQRAKRSIGEVLDRLILEGCRLNEELPPESHYGDMKKFKGPESGFDKFNPI